MLPTCPEGTPTFSSVGVVNSADVLPTARMSRDTIMAAAVTVEAVGTGAAPAQCQNARLFGAATSSDWWLQVRTADNRLWTIGLAGLGNAPFVQVGDPVKLDLDYQRTMLSGVPISPVVPRVTGSLQLSNAAGTPLLWAGSNI